MGVPAIDWSQLGIGVVAVLVLGGVIIKIIPSVIAKSNGTAFSQVVENNTRAMEKLNTTLEVNFARQEAKLDEIVAYVRSCR